MTFLPLTCPSPNLLVLRMPLFPRLSKKKSPPRLPRLAADAMQMPLC